MGAAASMKHVYTDGMQWFRTVSYIFAYICLKHGVDLHLGYIFTVVL